MDNKEPFMTLDFDGLPDGRYTGISLFDDAIIVAYYLSCCDNKLSVYPANIYFVCWLSGKAIRERKTRRTSTYGDPPYRDILSPSAYPDIEKFREAEAEFLEKHWSSIKERIQMDGFGLLS
ncbi:MAG TPA: hypothetical protein PLO53_01675 [Candidatus Hydrogenedentes bacterium]|nr:hypothetical protein [Candidatus Hydrogenedentota bacterium]HPU96643.1 hypothetical protein [Candidatus Hydrogenedentota bacterium]